MLKENLKYAIGALQLISGGIIFIPFVEIPFLSLSLMNLIQLGFGNIPVGESERISFIVDYLRGDLRTFSFLIIGLFILIGLGCAGAMLCSYKSAYIVFLGSSVVNNLFFFFISNQIMNQLRSINELFAFRGRLNSTALVIWVSLYITIILLSVFGLILAMKKTVEAPTEIMPEAFSYNESYWGGEKKPMNSSTVETVRPGGKWFGGGSATVETQFPEGSNSVGRQFQMGSDSVETQFQRGSNSEGRQFQGGSNSVGRQFPGGSNSEGRQFQGGSNSVGGQFIREDFQVESSDISQGEFCPSCVHPLDQGMIFCGKCGCKVI